MSKKIIGFILFLLGLFSIFYVIFNGWKLIQHPAALPSIQGTIYPEPINLPPFVLQSAVDKNFDDQDLMGHWSLIYFGYTHCPDICPNSLQILHSFYQKINKLPNTLQPKIIFISVDPARDKFPGLSQYVQYFNPNFQALTGSADNIETLTKSLGVIYQKSSDNNGNNENYLVEHSSNIFLINPQGQLVATFSAPHAAQKIAEDYYIIIGAGDRI